MLLSPIFPNVIELVKTYPALHIPDGFLNIVISSLFWVLTIILLSIAIRKTETSLGQRQIPLMGIMAAFIFAGQMINFPVAGGTSGHLLGGALAAIVLGPWAGMIVMTSVVALQALLFQDGGLVVMGANIFNMGLLTALVGFGLYRGAAGRGRSLQLGVAAVAAWLSVLVAAFVTSLQLWLSGTTSLALVMPAMLGVHALIGLGEALITAAALAFIMQTRPDLLALDRVKAHGGRGWVVASGLIIVAAVVMFSPVASTSPDGLERVAKEIGFLGAGLETPYQILPGYIVPALGETGLSTITAGLIGTLLVATIAVGVGRLVKRSGASSPAETISGG